MKTTFHFACCIAFFLTTATSSDAQIDVGGMVKRKVDQRIEQKTNEAIDRTLDETEKGVKDAAKGDKKSQDKKNTGKTSGDPKSDGSKENNSDAPTNGSGAKSTGEDKTQLKTYSKFDFVPGAKVIAEDRFDQVDVGDFPAYWNTNSSGEVVTVEGREGKWLKIDKDAVFVPDYITDLPENFTMQFEVMVTPDFSYYSSPLEFTFLPAAKRDKLNDFNHYSRPANAVRFGLHPRDAGSGAGSVRIYVTNGQQEELIRNEVSTTNFFVKKSTHAKVSVWRQKQRLRVYLNEEKVLDIPRAFDAAAKYNLMSICFGGGRADLDAYYITNIRLAAGAPDTRNKLITEGKFSTTGILFDSNSDKIKPESYGTLKEIATVLQENADVRVKVIGHTDSDGSDEANMSLSKKRAEAVKTALTKEFAIDSSRMETDGKGESQPVDKNDSAQGKANNRRVEFVKL